MDGINIKDIDIPRTYRGYLKEAYTYLASSIQWKHVPSSKFLILTTGRTGSTLLVDLLNSHPLIHCDNELLLRKVAFPYRLVRSSESLAKKKIYGFRLNTYNFFIQRITTPNQFVGKLIDSGYQLINLKRRNILKQAISRMYAYKKKEFHRTQGQLLGPESKMKVDLDQIIKEIKLFEYQREMEAAILLNRQYLELFYEDHFINEGLHQSAADRVFEYLEIPKIIVDTNLVKTTPDDLSKLIENFDEFCELISTTKYSKFLDLSS